METETRMIAQEMRETLITIKSVIQKLDKVKTDLIACANICECSRFLPIIGRGLRKKK